MASRRSMDELEDAALAALLALRDVPVGCGALGDRVFADVIREKGHHNGSAPYARVMGRVMARLKQRGLVRCVSSVRGGRGWVLTSAGKDLAMAEGS